MADQIISTVAPNIFEHCVGAAGEHLGYLWNYKSNMAKLESQVNKLDEERADKSHAITVAEKNAQKIRDRVKSWQDEAHKISEEAAQVLKDHQDKGKKRCLMGLCPNLVSRYQFSKRACKERVEIEEAMTAAQQIGQVSDPAVGQEKTILSTDGRVTFDSRKSLLEDIIKALQDETNNMVGVYGLGGMGKTTLVKQVASRATNETMFEEVVMASVTQNAVMKEIQGQIASMLGLKLDESTIAERASRIHERLKGKKVLIILDDLWKKLDLKDVGIPFGTQHMGCKILLTSRYLQVLSSMGTKREFLLGALKEEEAWRLFEEKTTDVVKNTVFLTVGKKVAKRCAGLPVLLVTVAASLSRRPQLAAWNDALKQLKKMNNKEMYDTVNSAIESISYNHLEKTHKCLFVLCGVIGGDASVEAVLQYCMGWDLFDDEVLTIQGARERLHSLILDLKDHCLLLDDHRRNSIKMHDVVRDIAISIGKKDFSMFSIGDNGAELNRWPMDNVLKRCTSIVLRACPNLSCLPQQLECPTLEMCILRPSSLTISNTFFEKTGKLKVLDMSGLCFSVLPSSISFLKNLQALRLHDCDNLKDISGVGELKKLQTLSFDGSGIELLPSEIGKLSELRLLDLRHCFELKVIPAGMLKGLSRLEELYVSQYFIRWEADVCISGCVRNNASLVELISDAHCLNKLEVLRIKDCEVLETIVGDEESTQQVFAFLFPKLRTLELQRLPKMECFYPREHTTKYPALKVLEVVDCGNLSTLDFLSFPEKQGDHQFEKVISGLKDLSIRSKDMMKILRLYNHFPPHLFQSLEKLTITEFQGESAVFPSKFLSTIHNQLKKFRVVNCSFQEVFPYEAEVTSHADDDFFLPQLTSLSLEELPELNSICKQDQYSTCILKILDKIEDLFVSKCSRLTRVVSPSVSFRLLRCLTITNCSGLINVMQLSTARGLKQLRMLSIKECEMIEEIIGGEVGDYELSLDDDKIIFSKLWYMKLEKLPRLTTFFSSCDYTFNFPRLETVTVTECPKMKSFSGGITTTPLLEKVHLEQSWKGPTCWENDLNTTIERIYTEMEAKRLATTLPSTNHFEAHAQNRESFVGASMESREGTETCKVVVEGQSKDSGKLVKVVDDIREKDKLVTVEGGEEGNIIYEKGTGKESEVSEEIVELRDRGETWNQSETSPCLVTKGGTIIASSYLCENEIEPRKGTEIGEEGEEEEVQRATATVSRTLPCNQSEAEAYDKGKGKELADPTNHSQVTGSQRATDSCVNKHFIPLLSEFLEIIQNQPLKSMSPRHVQFMEDAYRDLSSMNFTIDWFRPYVDKAREYLPVMEQKREISELGLEIVKAEADLEAMKEKKKAMEEIHEVIASGIDLDKALRDN